MNFYKKTVMLAVLLAATLTGTLSAQNEQSPYSRFGYGMIGDYATSMQRNMGGVGIAMTGGRQINVMNPASYAGIDSLTLLWDIGVDLTRLSSSENDAAGGRTTGKSFGGGLDYLTMQFPIGKHMGGSIGLVPYSSVGYSFGSRMENDKGQYIGASSNSGFGGVNELYVGISGRLFEGFTLGANISYQFGNLVNDAYVLNGTNTANTLFEQAVQVRDWNLLLGAQYTMEFRQLHKVTIGAIYSPKKDFHGHAWGTYYDVNADTEPDTVGYTSLKGGYSKPNTFGVGLSYTYDNRLMLEGDFTYQDWSKAKFDGIRDDLTGEMITDEAEFNDRWKVAFGVQYVPKVRGNYFQRIAYRCGANYTRDYITVAGNEVKSYGVAVGLGLPTPGTKTLINLGFEYKRRQASPASLVTENYFNITLGINFNELAFWQDKLR